MNVENAMHTAQQHSAETSRIHYQMDVRYTVYGCIYYIILLTICLVYSSW